MEGDAVSTFNGRVATSTNGITWTYQIGLLTAGWSTNENISRIFWDGLKFTVIGSFGYIATSTDGVTWAISYDLTYILTAQIFSTNYINSQYIVTCNGGLLYTSPDAVTWTENSNLATAGWSGEEINSIAWSGTTYVVTSNFTTSDVATSPDLTTWTLHAAAFTGWYGTIPKIIWAGTQFVITGSYGNLETSPDGVTWTFQSGIQNLGIYQTMVGLVWTGSLYVALAEQGKIIITSTDAVTWTQQTGLSVVPSTPIFTCLIWAGSQFIVGNSQATIATSPDAVTWTYRDSLSHFLTLFGEEQTVRILWTGAQYVVAGYSGRIATSPDGVTWTYRNGLRETAWLGTFLNDMIWTGSLLVVVGNQGRCATSPDGVTWTYQSDLGAKTGSVSIYSVGWTGTHLVAGGENGVITNSTDAGVTWTNQPQLATTAWGSANWAGGLAYTNGILMANGYYGRIATSIDNGVTWTYQTGLVNAGWYTTATYPVYAANYKFIIIGNGEVAVSDDGVVWTYNLNLRDTSWGAAGGCAVWDGYQYILAGDNGRTATSTDGNHWTVQYGLSNTVWGQNNSATCIAWTGYDSQIIVGGLKGNIATSPGIIPAYNKIAWTYQDGLSESQTNWGDEFVANDVAYNGSMYIVVGGGCRMASSTDALTWTFQRGLFWNIWNPSDNAVKINWNGTQWLVVLTSGYTATSPDGLTWTASPWISYTGWGNPINCTGLVWTGTQYVVSGGLSRIWTSPDGNYWTYQTDLATVWGGTDKVNASAWNGTTLVAASNTGKIATSTDGVTWTDQTSLSLTAWGASQTDAMIWAGTQFIAGSSFGDIATSPDGVTWTYRVGPTGSGLTNFKNMFWNGTITFAYKGGGQFSTSTDGITWTFSSTLQTAMIGTNNGIGKAILWTGSSLTLLANSNDFWHSSDLITWNHFVGPRVWGLSESVNDAVWAQSNRMVAVGDYGLIATSPDGLTWTTNHFVQDAWGWYNANAVIWTGTRYIMAGDGGSVANSPDGLTWTNTAQINAMFSVAPITHATWIKGKFYLACTGSAYFYTSIDNGVTWTLEDDLAYTRFGSIPPTIAMVYTKPRVLVKSPDKLIVLGSYGRVATSPLT